MLTIAHGHAALLADGQFGDPAAALAQAEARTRRVVSAFLSTRPGAQAGGTPSTSR